jgi:hypothetical protein
LTLEDPATVIENTAQPAMKIPKNFLYFCCNRLSLRIGTGHHKRGKRLSVLSKKKVLNWCGGEEEPNPIESGGKKIHREPLPLPKGKENDRALRREEKSSGLW